MSSKLADAQAIRPHFLTSPTGIDAERVTGVYGVFDIFRSDAGIRLNVKQFGAHQPSNLRMLLDCIEPGDHVLDIGAHVGTFAVPMARRAAPGKLVTVEGTPTTYELLVGNLRLNDVGNAEALNRVVSETQGFYEVNMGGNDRSYNTGAAKHDLAESGVPSISLSELVSRHLDNRIDCIKVDVEGMDYSVLQSGKDAIRACRPIVCFELILRNSLIRQFIDFFGPGYAYFLNVEPGNYQPEAFLPLLLDDFSSVESTGQQDAFAVPIDHPVYRKWTAALADPDELAYRSALLAKRLGHNDEAERLLGTISGASPRRDSLLKASLLVAQGKKAEGRACLAAVLEHDPDNVDALLRAVQLAGGVVEQLRFAERLEAAVVKRPMAAAVVIALARALQLQRRLPDALRLMEDFNQRFGEHPKALESLAEIEWKLGRREQAVAHVQRACEIRPTDIPGRIQWARYLTELGQVDRAREQLQDIGRILPGRPAIEAALANLGKQTVSH